MKSVEISYTQARANLAKLMDQGTMTARL